MKPIMTLRHVNGRGLELVTVQRNEPWRLYVTEDGRVRHRAPVWLSALGIAALVLVAAAGIVALWWASSSGVPG